MHGRRLYLNYIQRIRDLREDADCTQTQIAEYLGTSQTMYARYERGANEMPIRHLIALCQYYQVSADYILGFTNIKKPLHLIRLPALILSTHPYIHLPGFLILSTIQNFL